MFNFNNIINDCLHVIINSLTPHIGGVCIYIQVVCHYGQTITAELNIFSPARTITHLIEEDGHITIHLPQLTAGQHSLTNEPI